MKLLSEKNDEERKQNYDDATAIINKVKCKNPRCITSVEQELDHVFVLTDKDKNTYRCKYCETLKEE